MRTLELSLKEAIEVCKALGNDHRMDILKLLSEGPKNVNDLSASLEIPFSSTATNVNKLEDANLISTEKVPGRGSQKVSSKKFDRIIINLRNKEEPIPNLFRYELPVGEFVNCKVEPTCGLLSENGIIHVEDEPRSFYEPERKNAQLIWFRSGYIDYHFPNRIPDEVTVEELNFSAELCSEATYYKNDWPSDISCVINDIDIGYWTSPGDFGGVRGNLTPYWWGTNNTQYGVLKNWKVNQEGTFVDGEKVSNVTIEELNLQNNPYISIRLEAKKEAVNSGGLNVFGSKFGNYDQDLVLEISYK
ncbi:transcriptional regulator [Halobacillus andaensis]|uniref:Transcriptional regulator n=1 Tax=Halobacillus andaensis TaxID=1176239 RepID=A0A917B6R3_HALAA|nr:ArsR family transcriptional regulator [Halobacillus andaensis]MBP2004320.1 putative transcriptional regulator [Halobacillus andaensis]GGF22538.1 transcriptional regulator [Halobacillus andaensis]